MSKKARELLEMWVVFDTQLDSVRCLRRTKSGAELEIKELISRGFKDGVFEAIKVQEVKPKKGKAK